MIGFIVLATVDRVARPCVLSVSVDYFVVAGL